MAYDLYPAVDEGYNFAQVVRQALAVSLELRNMVPPMTTTERNNIPAGELWDGRVISNTTTGYVERYNTTLSQWIPLIDAAYVDSTTPDVYQGTAAPPTGTNYKTGDIYCQYQ
jgi:hypothetical protein